MLVLALKYFQDGDRSGNMALAKSIFLGLPLSLTFFIPFLVADRLRLSFWQTYLAGFFLIGASYFLHRALFNSIQ